MNNEFGDFQTPPELARRLVELLPARRWARVLEPTCGAGAFLAASASRFPDAELLGIELQPEHAAHARRFAPVIEADVFDIAPDQVPWSTGIGPTLVLGNPPWVTNAQLSTFSAITRPPRANTARARGIDAITGASNFDVAESVWRWAHTVGPDAIAFICKTQVARNIVRHCAIEAVPVAAASIRLIDARKWFGAAVDACWFVLEFGRRPGDYRTPVYPDLDAEVPRHTLDVVGRQLVRDADTYHRVKGFDGSSPLEWRQGVKHDAAAVMEVDPNLDIEPEHLFPLYKGTDVYHGRVETPTKRMIVPQRRIGQDTAPLADTAPKLWAYLEANGAALDRRKSRIYHARPRFSVFGVGDYTFAPYKIAISGLHKTPRFRIVGPHQGTPAVFDDTVYLLPFDDAASCAATHALLTSQAATDLLTALTFPDSKRPVTKRLLQRIDLGALGVTRL